MAAEIGREHRKGPRHVVGLDLGQRADPTALAVLRRSVLMGTDPEGSRPPAPRKDRQGVTMYTYDVVHMKRYELGTPYPAIVADVGALLRRPEIQAGEEGKERRPRTAIDATGVGRPVVDLFLQEKLPCEHHPITITGGRGHSREFWPGGLGVVSYNTAKLELCATVQALLGTGRLKVVPTLPLADVLKQELLNFQVKLSAAANEQFGAWRENTHDDLVLAIALAAWLSEARAGSFEPFRFYRIS